jgi:soluble lytic murein transglycosylase-like protein
MSGTSLQANDPPEFKDFKPKFVKAHNLKKGFPKIVQVPPQPVEKARPAPKAPAAAEAVPNTRYGWFWTKMSPALTDVGPGRLQDAMYTLSTADERIPVPRLQTLQGIAQERGRDILLATIGTRVSPALALAVIWTESAGRADASSSAGAQGLMQLMPATAARFGVSDSFEPAANIAGGVKYLDWLMKEFEGDPLMVLAAYNAGEGAVRKHKGVPPYAETRDYVPKVLAAFQLARGLCITPPELISDGCVFSGMGS